VIRWPVSGSSLTRAELSARATGESLAITDQVGLRSVPSSATAVSTTATATAVATTAATTTTAAAEATTSATTTATGTACALRTRFVDVKRSAANLFSVYRVNGAIAFRVVRHLYEGKPSGLTRITVGNNVYTVHTTVSFKQRTDVLFGRAETQVSYKNILHLFPFDLSDGAIRVGENTNAPKFAERSNTTLVYHAFFSPGIRDSGR
jgi:hypothetical protein